VGAQVEFAEMGGSTDPGAISDLEAKLASDSKDQQVRHDLSLALFGQQRYEEAFKHALDIVKMDREWEGGKGRELLFKFFDTLGNSHPEVLKARRRMASLLF
jgi:putative thioredoxin